MKQYLNKIMLSPWTAILTLILVTGVRITDPSFVESIRLRYFDTLIISKPITENNIFTVNIDESALDKGQGTPISKAWQKKWRRSRQLGRSGLLAPAPT